MFFFTVESLYIFNYFLLSTSSTDSQGRVVGVKLLYWVPLSLYSKGYHLHLSNGQNFSKQTLGGQTFNFF